MRIAHSVASLPEPDPEHSERFRMTKDLAARNTGWDEPTGPTPAPRFIAEVSSNHQTDLDRCLAFVDRAAEIGCDGVKFQLFRVRELFAGEILEQSAEHRTRARWELPTRFLAPISQRCRERGLAFACTPFYLRAVAELEPHVDLYKIASYELLWDDLLLACAQTGKPVVLSTGMADLAEVRHAVAILAAAGCRDLTLLHCVSGYPALAADANLDAITTLGRLRHDAPGVHLQTGWSDHTVEPGVIDRAVHRQGAAMIEFHLDLDGRGEEFAAGHCWLPEAMAEVIRRVRVGFAADGSGSKVPASNELEERSWRADPSDGLRPLRETRATWAP